MGIFTSGLNGVSTPFYSSYGSFSEPNWEVVPYKGMQAPSESELICQIKGLAEKRANITNDSEYATIDYQEEKLKAQFISSVSPDRKSICEQASKVIKSKSTKPSTPAGELTLIYYLNEHDGFTDANAKGSQRTSLGAVISPIINSMGGYDYDVGVGGNTILTSTYGKWYCTLTPAELQRQNLFNKIFENAYETAKSEKDVEPSSSEIMSLGKGHFNIKV